MSFLGVDSSTVEMDDSAGNGGRMTAKKAQYLNFYSSANFWLNNRQDMMGDQLKMFLDGVNNAPTDPNAFAKSSYLTGLGFTDYSNNWMVQFPKAYVVPWGNGQRSDAEANRIAQWCLDNGIQVAAHDVGLHVERPAFQAGSYVVSMSQALRGLAWNAFAAGTDIESKISILYASPAAWSHGLLVGRRHLRDPARRCLVQPERQLIQATNSLAGGVRGGVDAPSDFYSVTLKGVPEDKAVLGLLADGVNGYIAEAAVHQHHRRSHAGRHPDLPGRQQDGDGPRRRRPAGRHVVRAQRGRRHAHDVGRGRRPEDRHPRQQRAEQRRRH